MGSLNNCFSDLEVFFKRAALDHYILFIVYVHLLGTDFHSIVIRNFFLFIKDVGMVRDMLSIITSHSIYIMLFQLLI